LKFKKNVVNIEHSIARVKIDYPGICAMLLGNQKEELSINTISVV
jgi:hypothetical protein